MERRRFLQGLAVLPFVRRLPLPEFAPEEDPVDCPGCTGDPAEHPPPPDRILGYAEGQPAAVTIVTSGALLRISAWASVSGVDGKPVELRLYEAPNKLLAVSTAGGDMTELHVVSLTSASPGCHTYKLGYQGNVNMYRTMQPRILVERA